MEHTLSLHRANLPVPKVIHSMPMHDIGSPMFGNVPSKKSQDDSSITRMQNEETNNNGQENMYNQNEPTCDKFVIQEVVKHQFFPQVKFISKEATELQYSLAKASFCMFFTEKCNKPVDRNHMYWWDSAKVEIKSRLKSMKSDKNQAVKNEVYSECCIEMHM